MKARSQVLTCLLFAALLTPALGAPDAPKAEREARKAERAERNRIKRADKATRKQAKAFTKTYQLPAEELERNVAKLQTELAWHDDLAEARQAALEAGKPVLWIQALGDLSGLL